MKSKFIGEKFLFVMFGAYIASCVGVSQAAPICSPSYSYSETTGVNLTANCVPDADQSIDEQLGYSWAVVGGATIAATTSSITQTTNEAAGKTYTVKAQNFGGAYGAVASVALPSSFKKYPSPCTLKIQVKDAAPADATDIARGDSVTLIPACQGADVLDWYSSVGTNGSYTKIMDPPGGIVFPSVDTKYYVVGANIHGDTASNFVTVTVGSPAPPASGCTISPTAPSTVKGQPSPQLTANCSNSPTAWAWKLNGAAIADCPTTAATCTVPAASLPTAGGTYNVTVTPTNAGGAGNASPAVAITVDALPLSACTISPTAPSTTKGQPSPQLTANCTNSPTAWVWKLNGVSIATDCPTTSSTCTVPAAKLPTAGGVYNVTVTPTNAGGAGSPSPAAKITVSASPLSVCTSITPPTPAVTVGAASPQLTATCSNSPTAWVWKLNGVSIATNCPTTRSTCTVPAAKLPTVGGTYNVTVTANNAGGVGTQSASTTITVNDKAPIVCPQQLINKAFDYASPGSSQLVTMNRGQAVAFAFTTDNQVRIGMIQTAQGTNGLGVYRHMVISDKKCDFDYAHYDNRTGCVKTGALAPSVNYTTDPKAVYSVNMCRLKQGTTYYLNVRNENAMPANRGVDTCPAGQTCGYVAQLN